MVTLEHKKQLASRFNDNINQFKSMILIETTNINTNLMNQIKNSLLSQFGGKFLHGKKKCFAKQCVDHENATIQKLASLICGNVLFYFHNDSCAKIVKEAEKHVKQGSAKYGQPAQVDYSLQPQHTKLPPDTTKYFQKLRVPTKLNRGTIEITNSFMILEKGKPVNQMQIDVLSVLKILPYNYKPKVTAVYTNGEIVDPEIYRTPVDLISQLTKNSIGSALCLGYGTSFPAKPIAQSKNTDVLSQALALALELSDKFAPPEEFKAKIDLLKDPEAMAKMQASAATAAPTTEAVKQEAEAPKEESEESASEMDLDF